MLPIRFINLDRDTERRRRLASQLQRLRLNGERFPGVLWTALNAAEQQGFYSAELNARQFHKPLVNGEKGCYASHLRLWQWLIDSGEPGAVVLEDDVRLREDFAQVIAAIEALPPDWDMIKLIGRNGLGKREKLLDRQPLCSGYTLAGYRRIPSLTAGYVISREGARKLLATRRPFGRPIDVDLRHWWESERLRVLGIDPAALELDETSFDSSIGSKATEAGWRSKWRKFEHKLRYTLNNAWQRR